MWNRRLTSETEIDGTNLIAQARHFGVSETEGCSLRGQQVPGNAQKKRDEGPLRPFMFRVKCPSACRKFFLSATNV